MNRNEKDLSKMHKHLENKKTSHRQTKTKTYNVSGPQLERSFEHPQTNLPLD
jgi:hypothetical protein